MSVDRTLSGVGVGPGDPDHVTVKALRTLETADVILVPSTEARAGGVGRAEEIVCTHLPAKTAAIRRIPFSMAEHRGAGQRRASAWEASATPAIEAFEAGAQRVASATARDASVSSTFSYLSALVSRLVAAPTVLIPALSSMPATASPRPLPPVEGQEILSLVPWTVGPETLARVCEVSDTVVIYKGGREMTELRAVLDAQGRLGEAILGTDLGLPSEHLVPLSEVTDRAPYFSTVLAAPKRSTTGGRI